VFSIAHNRAMDAHRRASRERSSPEADVGESTRMQEAAPAPEPFDAELLAALDTLSEDQREVLILRFAADLSLEAVARITRRRVGAVKALQHRGLENLRRAVSSGDA
jgi:RNA polymerase sigma-70 factor (ECF subfamily)